jgi:Fe-S cluster biogenesis protein NfuA
MKGMLEDANVRSALVEMRSIIQVDGGDIELSGIDSEVRSVSLRLILEGASCEECVMPRDFLEQIALDIFRRASLDVIRVEVDDPREHPGYVPAEH